MRSIFSPEKGAETHHADFIRPVRVPPRSQSRLGEPQQSIYTSEIDESISNRTFRTEVDAKVEEIIASSNDGVDVFHERYVGHPVWNIFEHQSRTNIESCR